jgi:hypothetical protein
MGLRRKIFSGFLAVLGFMLSPLSWWNDAIVNLPLALAFAWGISSLVPRPWQEAVFQTAIIVGYWLTNVIGLILIRRGVSKLVSDEQNSSWHRELTKDLALGLGYTVLIVILLKIGILRSIEGYFAPSP